ncbi:hypothetical protein PC116_g18524 [Phytophthora cactorum]|uniref:Uncharacterized protein n=1 Tax=Phytophthora cactorum TaxID=29920 RepID=A0A8T1CMA9_9STRA|nr:hypothetical protein PC114_g27341 [Phytophthora cactorum]KAG2925673.1 hypothetical protein PC117_g15149 [Phytophthora cactorum]KAG3005133.1 hypothetical protein PC119_g15386 [Phytophthora cactorum]KAG3121797.1 hypothetical protein C6341_g27237 [Phytophthora cactorum]KAG4050189.1 hypothetical protein PC123_g14569 [Phytophthora cactorum]
MQFGRGAPYRKTHSSSVASSVDSYDPHGLSP